MNNCRFCNTPLEHVFVDLGHQPPSNSFLAREQLDEPETYYPLKVYVCEKCWLVQIPENKKAAEIFKEDYPYYSSQSPANVSHAKEYVEMMIERFCFGSRSRILELGSNDGYLLQWFKNAGHQYRVLGFEPASGPGLVAIKKGIPTIGEFFNARIASEAIEKFDLICGINVLAHQPDINDFVEGLRIALAPGGIITMEFPHLMRLVEGCQFDTIYHEHYSYFSLVTICEIFENHLLSVFDVDEIPEHGGSLRIYAEHSPSCRHSEKLRELLLREGARGMFTSGYYTDFRFRVNEIRANLMYFLYVSIQAGKTFAAYGAAAKGNTFLNFCGIKSDLVSFIVDRSPYKQGKYLPGSHIPVVSEERLKEGKPNYVLILPWNLKNEIMGQLKYIREWGGRFVIAIPKLEVC